MAKGPTTASIKRGLGETCGRVAELFPEYNEEMRAFYNNTVVAGEDPAHEQERNANENKHKLENLIKFLKDMRTYKQDSFNTNTSVVVSAISMIISIVAIALH